CPFVITSPAMSSVRGSDGSPCTVMARYVPFSFDTHSAVSSPGTLTKGVLIGCAGVTHGRGSADEPLPRPADARYECKAPLPPPSAAGLAQAAAMPSPATRANLLFAGGGTLDLKEA